LFKYRLASHPYLPLCVMVGAASASGPVLRTDDPAFRNPKWIVFQEHQGFPYAAYLRSRERDPAVCLGLQSPASGIRPLRYSATIGRWAAGGGFNNWSARGVAGRPLTEGGWSIGRPLSPTRARGDQGYISLAPP
jgi:hypothetical protein